MLTQLKKEMQQLANPEKAKVLSGFFKTGPGQYGEGDIFLGITVPESRKLAIKYKDLPFPEIRTLLNSPTHEARLVALLLLVHRYKKGSGKDKEEIFDFYLKNKHRVNNWDLVDLTADKIVGEHLLGKDTTLLSILASSTMLWDRRIAIVATYAFIKQNQFKETLRIAGMLLNDRHDLMHKAVGWMLREVGKRDQQAEEEFLKKHYHQMPRTMLRYAIERFSDEKRQQYLKK